LSQSRIYAAVGDLMRTHGGPRVGGTQALGLLRKRRKTV